MVHRISAFNEIFEDRLRKMVNRIKKLKNDDKNDPRISVILKDAKKLQKMLKKTRNQKFNT